MKVEPKTIWGLFAILVLTAVGYVGIDMWRSRPLPVPPCVAGPNEMCPPADWMASYNDFERENKKLQEKMRSSGITDEQRLLSGWAQDLQKGVPVAQGYTFNERTKKFEKPQPAAPPPSNAYPPEKK